MNNQGIRDGMVKVAVRADVEEQVLTALTTLLPRGVDPGHDDELDDLLPDVGDLEALVMAVEESFDIDFTDAEAFDLFAFGTVGDLIEAVTKHLMSKTASVLDAPIPIPISSRGRGPVQVYNELDKIVAAAVKKLHPPSEEKTAGYDRAYYIQNRERLKTKSRTYRMRNLHSVRRKAKAYRRKVKRRMIRPRKRVGSAGSGYHFIAR